jgi:hypothetical protein
MDLPFPPVETPFPELDAMQREIDQHLDAAFLAEIDAALADRARDPAAEDAPAAA